MTPNMLKTILDIITIIIVLCGSYFLLRYIYGKDYNNWLKPILTSKAEAPIDQKFSGKEKLVIVLTPFLVVLVFVILYLKFSEKKFTDFLLYGFASVVPNLIFIFILFYIYKDKFLQQLGGNYSVAIVYILTLIIPFFMYFVLISFLFLGWEIPFNY